MKSGPVQFTLIAAAALSAFTLQPAAQGARDQLAMLFLPVAAPARAAALWLTMRVAPPAEIDLVTGDQPRTADEYRRQNAILITQVQNLQAQLEDLRPLSATYRELGNLQDMVEPALVSFAGPVANRQTLTISTWGLSGVREQMPVVHPRGLVGTIQSTGLAGGTARVLLVTDPESRVQARFASFGFDAQGQLVTSLLPLEPVMAAGDGTKIVVPMIPALLAREHLKTNQVLLVDDNRLGAAVKGLRLGRVVKINLPPTNAGHASVEIEPIADFATLPEVLVVTGAAARRTPER